MTEASACVANADSMLVGMSRERARTRRNAGATI